MSTPAAGNATACTTTSNREVRRMQLPRLGVLIVFLLFAFVVTVPSLGALPQLSSYDSKRILQIGLLLLSGIWVLFTLTQSNGPLVTYTLLPSAGRRVLTLVLALGYASAVLAPLSFYALLEVSHLFLLGVLAVSLAHLYRLQSGISDWVLVGVVLLSAVLYEVSFGVGYAMSHVLADIDLWPVGYVGFEHVRFFNQFQSWTLPLLVLAPLLFVDSDGWKRNALLIPLAMWWMLLFASGGRGTLLGVMVAAVFLFISFGKRAFLWIRFQGVAALVGVIAYGFLFKVAATTGASLLDRNVTTDMGRFYYWRRAVEMIEENWLLGIGPMHFAGFREEYWSHPHNTILQWAAEWGVPATALVTLLILWAFLSWIRQSRRCMEIDSEHPRGQIRIALTASLITAGVHALFSGITIMPMSQTTGVLVLGWTLGHFITSRTDERPLIERRPSPSKRLILAAIFGLALGTVVLGTTPDAFRRQQSERNYVKSVDPNHLHPRFWRQGAIRY